MATETSPPLTDSGREPSPHAPQARPTRRSTRRSLLRLWPHVRPALWPLVGSGAATLCATVAGLVVPLVLQRVIDGPIAHRDGAALWPMAGVVFALGLLEAALLWLRRRLVATPLTRVERRIREDLYNHLQRQSASFHDRWSSGQLLSRATSDVALVRMFFSFLLTFLMVNSCTFLIGVALLLWMNWLLALIVLGTAVPLIAFCAVFEHKYQSVTRAAQDMEGDLATVVEESILGVRVLKAFGRHRSMERQFAQLAGRLRDIELHKVRLLGLIWSVMIILPELAVAVLLVCGVWMVSSGQLSAGELVSFFGLVMLLRWPVESIGFLLAGANDTAAAADRLFEVLDSSVPVRDPEPDLALPPARARNGAATIDDEDQGGLLRFEEVSFRYPESPASVPDLLRGVDLEVRPGETVALVGATGSGKTALTSLVPRLYDVTAGRVTVDGVDIRQLPLARLRELLAVAFEDPMLFSASVRENLLFGYQEGTDAEVNRAVRVAQAGFVHELPWGLDTRIGEQGLNLSGGQRQRLALARAVVSQPRFLILDDPLSALDVHTEARVEEALRDVLATTSALVVAHRPSTVQLADRVALLRDGRIVAVGRHSELLEQHADYRNLLSSGPAPEGAAESGTPEGGLAEGGARQLDDPKGQR